MFKSIELYVNTKNDQSQLIKMLDDFGYRRCKQVSIEGDYSLKGETLIVYPITFEYPIRIDIADNVVRTIKSIDLFSFKTITDHKGVILLPVGALKRKNIRSTLTENIGEQPISSFVDIEPGDYVVHIDYGIGKYTGFKNLHKDGKLTRFFVIGFKDTEKLLVPEKELYKLQRYISFHRKPPKLSSLKSRRWAQAKKNAASGACIVAKELIEIQARRESAGGFNFSPDTEWQSIVERSFPYKETPDQLKATVQVKKDMENSRPMDRLLCGDVGYGKTEVALRAAFKAVMDGKQVVFLVPTTILAEQHTNTFRKRFKDFPLIIEMLNRFRTQSEQKEVLRGLTDGTVDIVIGTHRLLSDDVSFRDLGLLIVDEEQRFGVTHKERMKKMKLNVDVLTLTATPIPRTLYLALMGGKDISIIETPPLERHPIQTSIVKHDKQVIKTAILKEIRRNGQVFYVHNRVESIDNVAVQLQKLVPEARLMVGHGQMSSRLLEKTMLRFIRGEIDVFVCTTIVESGIDIPNANTMIVDNAENFGLAELYQLRGRIGRFDRKAYAYLVVKDFESLTYAVQKRLNAIKKYQELGAGFKIAMRDLEMRGAGNILGVEQSGFIDQVGFDLYCRLLKAEIDKINASFH